MNSIRSKCIVILIVLLFGVEACSYAEKIYFTSFGLQTKSESEQCSYYLVEYDLETGSMYASLIPDASWVVQDPIEMDGPFVLFSSENGDCDNEIKDNCVALRWLLDYSWDCVRKGENAFCDRVEDYLMSRKVLVSESPLLFTDSNWAISPKGVLACRYDMEDLEKEALCVFYGNEEFLTYTEKAYGPICWTDDNELLYWNSDGKLCALCWETEKFYEVITDDGNAIVLPNANIAQYDMSFSVIENSIIFFLRDFDRDDGYYPYLIQIISLSDGSSRTINPWEDVYIDDTTIGGYTDNGVYLISPWDADVFGGPIDSEANLQVGFR